MKGPGTGSGAGARMLWVGCGLGSNPRASAGSGAGYWPTSTLPAWDGRMVAMHLIYLDESGDPGARNSPTSHYVLAGFAVHHSAWSTFDQKIKSLRLKLERRYGYPVTKELHACELLGAATTFCGVGRAERLLMARRLIMELSTCTEIRVFAWVMEKGDTALLERIGAQAMADLDEWSSHGLLPAANDCRHLGFFIVHDHTSNPPFRTIKRGSGLIGNPVGQCSRDADLIQVADLIAYVVKQKFSPNKHALRVGTVTLCDKLLPVCLGWRFLGK